VDLDAVASFHGSLGVGGTAEPGTVRAGILVANGADDPFVTAGQIADFKAEMDAAGADYTFINYPGVKHSFTNPDADALGEKFGLPLAYDAAADADSWAQMQAFFRSSFAEAAGTNR
jgi:dienelactone hydrolase